jgi:hypothetical protein
MPKRKDDLVGTDYLEAMLNWDAFAKAHPNFRPALQEVLNELYQLRKQVNKQN